MIKSIRYFLLISLLISITIASAINGIGNYLLDEKVIQPYLDNQLARFSYLINTLHETTKTNAEIHQEINHYLKINKSINQNNFIFQVWNKEKKLLIYSKNTEHISFQNLQPGFTNLLFNNYEWRIYTYSNPKSQMKIIVGEHYTLRRELADDIARNNANILLITYPVFGLLVWFIITLALRSITRVTTEIANRASTFLEPVQLTAIPTEIKPLVAELNKLFIRLQHAFERNKRFAADAAHELRTPLAALKTHLQVGLKADNDEDRKKALTKVLESVDRSSHVVDQLLTLSRLGEEEGLSDVQAIDLHKIATEIIAYLAPHALEKNIEIELGNKPAHPFIVGNEIAMGILIRNLVDNAIRYTPPHGEVKVNIIEHPSEIILNVIDTGSGIPSTLRERVFERFYRILGNKASGSGLGLAIVGQITTLHHGNLSLSTPANGIGLQIDIAFPKHHA